MKTLCLLIALLCWTSAFAGKKVAVVTMLRGQVDSLVLGKTVTLKSNDPVEDGAVIKTSEKSFVKITFFDKSQMNIGPNSEIKIEKFSTEDSGVIDLVKGKIRSQVTKDYLQIKDKDKSKLFIKTPNAVMGVRGTDFIISTNGTATTAILFEGEIVFNKLNDRSESSSAKLEEIVDRGVRLHPGDFSVMEQDRVTPTTPALLNVQQRENLEKNNNFESDRTPSNTSEGEAKNSVVPEGLNGEIVSNKPDVKVESVEKVRRASSDPNGFVSGEKVKPANGSFVHVESGTIIPPGPDSVLDANTNSYIPGASSGKVAADGTFVPPKNVEITDTGKIFVAVTDKAGVTRVQEVTRPVPVLNPASVSLGNVGNVISRNPALINPNAPVSNDILNKNFAPSGLNDLSNMQRNTSGGVTPETAPAAKSHADVLIRVKN